MKDKPERAEMHRHDAIREMLDSESKFFRIFHSSPISLLITRWSDGVIVDVNEAIQDVLGFSREEMIGRTTTDLGVWINPDERAKMINLLAGGRHVRKYPCLFKSKDGSILNAQVTLERVKFGDEWCMVGSITDETQEHTALAALRKSKEDWERTFDVISDSITILDKDYRITRLNKAAADRLGIPPDECLGRFCFELGHNSDAPPEWCPYQKLLNDGQVHRVEVDSSGPNGHFAVSVYPITGENGLVEGCVHIAQDITEKYLSDQALHESEERYRRIVGDLRDGFILIDRTGALVEWNHEMEKITGWKRAEVLGRPAWEVQQLFFPDGEENPERLERNRERFRSLLAMDDPKPVEDPTETVVRKRDGSSAIFQETSFIIPLRGGSCLGTIFRDVTGQRHAEALLKNSLEQLQALSSKIEEIREDERKSISREVHDELGQLLTVIKMQLTGLALHDQAGHSKPDARLDSITGLVDRAIDVVHALSTRLRPAILDDLGFQAALEWQSEEFRKYSGINCNVYFPEEEIHLREPLTTALFRVLGEALTNVVRHARATTVDVSLESTTAGIRLSVSDNGIGIGDPKINAPGSLGLLGMRERIRPFGGTLTIRRGSTAGTVLVVEIPALQSRAGAT